MTTAEPTEIELADWVVRTCLLFGSTTITAHRVAALFIEGLQAHQPTGETHAPV